MDIDISTWVMAVLALAGTTLVIVGEFIDETSEKRKLLRRGIVIGGGVLAGGIACVGAIQQAAFDDKMERLALDTRDLVTGGESFVWLLPAREPNADFFHVSAVQGGDDVPAFDVSITVEPTGKCDGLRAPLTTRFFPAVTPQMFHLTKIELQPTCAEAFYQAYIHTRNRIFYEQILLNRDEPKTPATIRLIDMVTGETVHAAPRTVATRTTWPAVPDVNKKMIDALNRHRKLYDFPPLHEHHSQREQ